MATDIRQCAQLGCDGVVIGMLRKVGRVDVDRCAQLVGHAGDMEVTFHAGLEEFGARVKRKKELGGRTEAVWEEE